MDGLSIDEISDERIKVGLIKAVKDLSNSNNVKLCIEHGSKKGKTYLNMLDNCKKTTKISSKNIR